MKRIAPCLLATIMTIPANADEVLRGPAMVRDAMTIAISGARVRLAGIAVAEEKMCGAYACSQAAMSALKGAIADQPVTCSTTRKLGHGFFLGSCHFLDGRDMAEFLIGEGLVLADPVDGVYAAGAARAQAERRGLWQ